MNIKKSKEEFEKKFVRNGEVGGSLDVAGEKADELWSFIESALKAKEKEAYKEGFRDGYGKGRLEAEETELKSK